MIASLFVGTSSSRAAVNTIYLGSNTHVSGGSCVDPDFSTAGGYDAAMASALADIDADGDTIVICNGRYSPALTNLALVGYRFTIRAETRRQVVIDGTNPLLVICAPSVTIRGLSIVNLHSTAIQEDCDQPLDLTIDDVELGFSESLATTSLDGSWDGELNILNSRIHDNQQEVIALWGTINVENTVFERNFSIVGLFAPVKLSILRSEMRENVAFVATVGATSCLTVGKSTVEGNGGLDIHDVSRHTLVAFGLEDDWGCAPRITNSNFENNLAQYGGALTLVTPDVASVVKRNTFTGNRGQIAGAIAICAEEPNRKLQALARRIGLFKSNRYRRNAASDRRSNNYGLLTGGCPGLFGG